MVAVETEKTMDFTIGEPETVEVSIWVDRDQNGKIDRMVDTSYGLQRDGRTLCPQCLIDGRSSTACGAFRSAARLSKVTVAQGRRTYTLRIPKEELSEGQVSASVVLRIWNGAKGFSTLYPASGFQHALQLKYTLHADHPARTPDDFAQIAREGYALRPGSAEAIEKSLAQSPEDVPARARLLGYYFASAYQHIGVEGAKSARERHIPWLISNHPESKALDLAEATIDPELGRLADAEGYERVRQAWLQRTEAGDAPVAVLTNAARFLQTPDPKNCLELLKRARRLEPANEDLLGRLCLAYGVALTGTRLMNENGLPVLGDAARMTAPLALALRDDLLKSGDARIIGGAVGMLKLYGNMLYHDDGTRAAIDQEAELMLQRAIELQPKYDPGRTNLLIQLCDIQIDEAESEPEKLELRKKKWELEKQGLAEEKDKRVRVRVLGSVAKEDFDADDFDTAERLASELLSIAPEFKSEWYYTAAVFQANTILGRVAVHRGDLDLAEKYLIDSGNIDPSLSPGTLTSFGPNMLLAKDLVEKGRREAVLKFFDEINRFWGGRDLPVWRKQVEQGQTPDFGSNLVYW